MNNSGTEAGTWPGTPSCGNAGHGADGLPPRCFGMVGGTAFYRTVGRQPVSTAGRGGPGRFQRIPGPPPERRDTNKNLTPEQRLAAAILESEERLRVAIDASICRSERRTLEAMNQRFTVLEADMKAGFERVGEEFRRLRGDMENGFAELRPPEIIEEAAE